MFYSFFCEEKDMLANICSIFRLRCYGLSPNFIKDYQWIICKWNFNLKFQFEHFVLFLLNSYVIFFLPPTTFLKVFFINFKCIWLSLLQGLYDSYSLFVSTIWCDEMSEKRNGTGLPSLGAFFKVSTGTLPVLSFRNFCRLDFLDWMRIWNDKIP